MANTTYAQVNGSLTADVANNGTIVIPAYPVGYSQASFTGVNASSHHSITFNNNDQFTADASQMSVSFGSSTITITNLSGATWKGSQSYNGSAATYRLLLDIADPATFSGVKQATVPVLTDSTGGTAATTLAAITAGASYAQADAVATKNALAQLALSVNTIGAALKAAGITS